MEDQAKRLREIMGKKVITICSGKGGVGKTTISVALSIELSKLNRKVLLIDADLSLANADLLLGVVPKFHIGNYLEGNVNLNSIIEEINPNLEFIPAASGITKFTNLTDAQLRKIKNLISSRNPQIVIFDAPAGIGENVINFCKMASHIVLVITPDPVSITDAYALMKIIKKEVMSNKNIFTIVNMISKLSEKDIAHSTISKVAEKYLGIVPKLLGSIPYDESVRESFRLQKPFNIVFPKSKASESIRQIAKDLLHSLHL